MVGQREVAIAAPLRLERHLLDRALPVRRPRRVAVELADEVARLDERRQAAVARGLELAAVLAQLGRDEGVAEEAVELLLGAEAVHLARLDHGDAVLGDGQSATLRVLAQRDVVVLRAGEVLEQAAVVLGRHDAKVEPEALLRHDGRLRVAVRRDLEHPRQLDEVREQRRRVGCGRDHVEIAERLAPAPHAPGGRDLDRRRVRAERLDDVADDRQALGRAGRAAPAPGRSPWRAPRGSRSSLFAPSPCRVPDALLLGGLAKAVERRHPELAPDPGRRLRAETREAQELRHLVRHLRAPLLERGHLAGLGQLDDLRLDRRADPRQLLRLARERELGDRRGRLPDPRRRAPVREHAKPLLAEDLRDVGQGVEGVGDVRVAGQRGHASIIGTGSPPAERADSRHADPRRRLRADLRRAGEHRAARAGAR